jgi:hypothetical protein
LEFAILEVDFYSVIPAEAGILAVFELNLDAGVRRHDELSLQCSICSRTLLACSLDRMAGAECLSRRS